MDESSTLVATKNLTNLYYSVMRTKIIAMWLEEEDTTQRVVIELEDGRNLYYWPKSISTPYGSLSTYFSPHRYASLRL